MREYPLPADMAARWGHLPYLRYVGNQEWHSACPVCGDSGHEPGNGEPDRFYIRAADGRYNARGKCRRCGHFEWVDQDNSKPPDPVKIKEMEELRRQYAEEERRLYLAKQEELQKAGYWRGFHDAMKEAHRAIWRQAGIPDEFQDFWELGFTQYESGEVKSPALTIPYFSPGRSVTTIQYRLTNPPRPNDKYRFQAGLRADLWLADPDCAPVGATILCEGMKKAGVLFIELVAKAGLPMAVAAVPGKMPSDAMLEKLATADPVYVCLDPDAYEGKKPAARRLGQKLGDRARYVRLPAKADDLFVQYGFTPDLFKHYLRQATGTM